MKPTQSESILKLLTARTLPDLASLYNINMEVQVNVAQDNGERIDGEFKGRKWVGWKDELGNVWKAFRIPYNANTDPFYEDKEINFDLEKHAEGIGMTGWDWKNRLSRWVAFDFDAITGHSDKHTKKLSESELKELKDNISNIEWATIRHSTSGNGLHIYVFLDPPISTATHTEHAALARSILGLLSAKTGANLEAKIDACGQNMWVWHRKMKDTNGLQIIKVGTPLKEVPANWREHVNVISGKRRKVNPEFVKEYKLDSVFEELSGQRTRIPLDEQHRKLLEYIEKGEFTSWFDADNNMLVTHTKALKDAHEALGFKGIFETVSGGNDSTQNCFCYPLRNGAWVVRRYTPGVAEASTWDQDRSGFTRCFYNRDPDLRTVAMHFGGVEHPQGGYHFPDSNNIEQVLKQLGSSAKMPEYVKNRPCKAKYNKDDKLVIEFEHDQYDKPDDLTGWILEKGKWKRVFNVKDTDNQNEIEIGNYDDIIRHIVDSESNDMGWVIKSDNLWRTEPMQHTSIFLQALGLETAEVKQVLGSSVVRPWMIVNKPFDSEYPGDRLWNRKAPQFTVPPSTEMDSLHYPSWLAVLNHCGQALDPYVKNHEWCRNNSILTGADYLKCWIASIFQNPTEPLPYLFFYSEEQNTGKSIFHEALSLLITRGVVRADQALSDSNFNGELENAVVCVIEETDVGSKNKNAYNKIKDWVTSRVLPINKKYETPYTVINCTHWIHCSNDSKSVPIFPGDTRIVMIHVPVLKEIIPKRDLIKRLQKEAPDFLAAVLNLEVPECNDRLGLPILLTADKENTEFDNKSVVDTFIEEHCFYIPGAKIKYSEFFMKFQEWLDPNELSKWSKIRVGKELNKHKTPKGRDPSTNDFYVANISFDNMATPGVELVLSQGNTLLPKGKQ